SQNPPSDSNATPITRTARPRRVRRRGAGPGVRAGRRRGPAGRERGVAARVPRSGATRMRALPAPEPSARVVAPLARVLPARAPLARVLPVRALPARAPLARVLPARVLPARLLRIRASPALGSPARARSARAPAVRVAAV